MDDGRACPAEQGGHDQADALAGARRRKGHDMFRAVVAQIARVHAAQENARVCSQPRGTNVASARPTRGAIGRDVAPLSCAPDRTGDGGPAGDKAAGRGDATGLVEHDRGIGIEVKPPGEDRPRRIDRRAAEREPGHAKLGLIGKRRRRHCVAHQTPAITIVTTTSIWPRRSFVGVMRTSARTTQRPGLSLKDREISIGPSGSRW